MRAEYGRFVTPILRGIVLIVALYASLLLWANLLFGAKSEADMLVFMIASGILIAMAPKAGTLPAIESEGNAKARPRYLPDWSLLSYLVIMGLEFDWTCAFCWFSGRYAFFSVPVIGVAGLIVASYATIGFLVARRSGGNWRTALMVFAGTSLILCGYFALRLFRIYERVRLAR